MFHKVDSGSGIFTYFARMYRFSLAFMLLAICYAGSLAAQTEHWDTYVATFGGRPGSVLVDMGLKETAPDARYPYLVITGPRALKCDKNGIPDKAEIPELEDILAATNTFLIGVTPRVLCGTFTWNCERLNYYYVKDTSSVRAAVRRMYNRSYPNYQFAINIKNDPDWKTYRTFLYPDDTTMNWMANQRKVTALSEQGDSLKSARDIEFDLWFYSEKDRGAFKRAAEEQGFNTVRMTQSRKLFGIVLGKNSPATMEKLGVLTTTLEALAKRHQGNYSGWHSPVGVPASKMK